MLGETDQLSSFPKGANLILSFAYVLITSYVFLPPLSMLSMARGMLVLCLIVPVIILSGCINPSPVCNKPYMQVGYDCCLDDNGDGICDSEKPITTTIPKTITVEKAIYGCPGDANMGESKSDCSPRICCPGASDVTGSLSDACNGRAHCEVLISNSVFGDPSAGCFKGAYVVYACGSEMKSQTICARQDEGQKLRIEC